ncbi:MAG: hypothetical protein ABI333_06590 [bacterium]
MIRKLVVSLTLAATALPLYVGVRLLSDSWFWALGVLILVYAAIVVTAHLVARRPLALKILVLVANAGVLILQGWKLLYEPAGQPWYHVIAIAYAMLSSASVMLLRPGESLRALYRSDD